MQDYTNTITINLQIALNKKMHEAGHISYKTYSKTNEILISRLTNCNKGDIIIHSEMI